MTFNLNGAQILRFEEFSRASEVDGSVSKCSKC